MNRFKQCAYTLTLILTCLVASPFIFKQIWDSSEEKKAKAKDVPAEVDIFAGSNQQTSAAQPASSEDDNQATEPASSPETASEDPVAEQPSAEEPEKQTETEAAESATEPAVTPVTVTPDYFDDALFIGDSRTVGIRDYGTLTNADYFCDVGLSAASCLEYYVDGYLLTDKLASKKYGKVYIMLGVNEIGNDFEYTLAAFRSIIDTIRTLQPDAIIYLEGNLHVCTYAETSTINNERINYLNSRLREMADGQRIFYIDINPVFDDENGALREEYTGDGVHVVGKYYLAWSDWFCVNTYAAPGSAEEAADGRRSNTDQ